MFKKWKVRNIGSTVDPGAEQYEVVKLFGMKELGINKIPNHELTTSALNKYIHSKSDENKRNEKINNEFLIGGLLLGLMIFTIIIIVFIMCRKCKKSRIKNNTSLIASYKRASTVDDVDEVVINNKQ